MTFLQRPLSLSPGDAQKAPCSAKLPPPFLRALPAHLEQVAQPSQARGSEESGGSRERLTPLAPEQPVPGNALWATVMGGCTGSGRGWACACSMSKGGDPEEPEQDGGEGSFPR